MPKSLRYTFSAALLMVAAAPVLSAGIIYEADFFHGAIYAISSTGTKTQLAGNLNTPYGMAFSNSGDLYYSETGGGITKINTRPESDRFSYRRQF